MSLDWANLGFGYIRPRLRFHAEWRDGAWQPGQLVEEATLTIEEGATGIHYAQQCFEGLKAFSAPDGAPLVFRARTNAARIARSAERALIPPPPEALFMEGVHRAVLANRELLPPHGSGASLYIRPFLLGVGDNLGLRPAPRYIFRVFVSPVGPYFKGGLDAGGIKLVVSDRDRVAPRGVGAYKLGGNYCPGLLLSKQAKEAGHDELLYLDPLHRKYLDEAGSANVFGILPGGVFATPNSPNILPSVTMDSVLALAREDLGLTVERRQVDIDEVARFEEMGCTGTAAVITPVKRVTHDDRVYEIPSAPGPHTRAIYDRLTGIQRGRIEDTRGWVERLED